MDMAMTKEGLKRAAKYLRFELKEAQLGGNPLGICLHDFIEKGAEILDVLSEEKDIEGSGQAIGGLMMTLFEGIQKVELEVTSGKPEKWATRPGAENVPATDTSNVRPADSWSPVEAVTKDWNLSAPEQNAYNLSDVFGIKHDDKVFILKDRHKTFKKTDYTNAEFEQARGEFANSPISITVVQK